MFKPQPSWCIAGTLWLINPVFSGCNSNTDPEFDFGEAELLDILDDVNNQAWETTYQGEPVTIQTDFVQVSAEGSASWLQPIKTSPLRIATASACSSRSFLAEAAACIDTSSLPIEGTVTISSKVDSESEPETFMVSGSVDVYGTILNNAEIWVSNDDIRLSWNGNSTEDDLLVLDLGWVE